MNRSEDIGQLAAALSQAQAKMEPASKDATNPFFDKKYADLGSIISVIQPILAENGLSFTQLPLFDGRALSIETVIMHASGQWVSSTMAVSVQEEKGLSLVQGMGKAITYLRRYGLAAMFGVYSDSDDDGNGADEVTERKAVKKTVEKVEAVCPVCSGPMWDNRNNKTNPKAPDFKCKKKDCRGVIWPRGDEDGDEETIAAPEPRTDEVIEQPKPASQHDDAPLMTDGQRRRLHGLGSTAYGPDWDTKRHELVAKVTKGRSQSSADLTAAEAEKLINGIERKLDASTVQVGEQPPAFPDSTDLHPDSAHLEATQA